MAGVRENTVSNIVSGSIASFKSVGEVPLKSLKVNFNPIQEGDGDPSPSNVRPISGWTGLNVYKGSKNFLTDTVVFVSTVRKTEMEYFVQNNSATIDRKANVSCFILIKALDVITSDMVGLQFVYTASTINVNDAIVSCDSNGSNRRTVTNGIITTADIGKMLTVRFYAGGEIKTYTATNMQLSLNSTSTTYEPYNGTTVPVSWSDLGTVYGGYVDLISGEVWATWEVASAKWGDIKKGSPSATTGYYEGKISFTNKITILHDPSYYGSFTFSNVINKVRWDGSGITPEHYYGGNENEKGVCYIYCNYDDDIIIQIAAKLATPVLIDTIDPITIKSLIGQNNIWSNADTVEVQYCALESLDIYKQRFKTNEPHLQDVSGNVISFKTDMVAPLKECKVYFQPIQASGTPSPNNVLSISGWTGMDIYHHGETLPITYRVNTTTNYGVTWTVSSDGTVHAEGTPTSYAGCVYGEINVNGDEVLYGVIKGSLNNVAFNKPALFDANGNSISYSASDNILLAGLDLSQYTGVKKVRVNIKRSVNDKYMIGDARVIIQKGSVPSIDTSTLTFPSTYYGGWCNPLTGIGEIVYKYLHLTGNENWYMEVNSSTVSNASYLASIRVELTGQNSGVYKPAISDKLAPSTYWAPDLYCAVINTTSRVVIGLPQELSTKEAVNNWIQSIGGIDVVWESMFPTSFSFTPINPIKTLKNQNNIWSNTNSTTQVKYWTHGSIADKRKVVWNQLAPPLISDYWNDRNSTETITTFENGIATTQFILLSGSFHTMCTKNSSRTYQNHKYYSRLDCMLNKSVDYMGGDVANIAWSKPFIGNLNEWGTYSTIVTGEQDRNSTIYYPRMARSGGLQQGTIAKTKNPFVIDLTQMFGEGNEPSTAAEFEALCSRNNIDLTQYQPYDEGTQIYWYF